MDTNRMAVFGIIWIAFILDRSSSYPDECLQEKERLQSKLRILDAQLLKQNQLLQHFMKNQERDEVPAVQEKPFDLGDKQYTDCAEIYRAGHKVSGLYHVRPLQSPAQLQVYCDMTEGGGWTVFQRRLDGHQSFDRDWNDYKNGFGDMESASGEFWLGNDHLHYLTSQGDYNLRINLEDFDGDQRFAVYKKFKVDNEEAQYQLGFGEYSGTAGDALSGTYHPEVQWWASHQGMRFSTRDRDNDRYDRNCAAEDRAGWWFNRCHSANLNGLYYKGPYSAATDNGIVWYPWRGWWYSLKSVLMKIRPAEFEPNEV